MSTVRPVKRIAPSEKDMAQLQGILRGRGVVQEAQPEHYQDRVVVKPWGYEFLLFENASVAAWFLHIGRDHSTSMHCHPNKMTSLTLLGGRALCNTFHHRNFLSAGDSVIIEPGAFHSTKALSPEGISLLEVETPPAKLDLVRLEDAYGRERSGYEGCDQMTVDNLADFAYFHLAETDPPERVFCLPGRFALALAPPLPGGAPFVAEEGSLYCAFRGSLTSRREGGGPEVTVLGTGETGKGVYLNLMGPLAAGGDTLLLKMTIY
jgi:mannose-6-phosphate isomerase-like protein (cupin superfamily)